MSISIDMSYKSVNHAGEELCGDKVEIVNTDDCKVLILADGMGSGVRANILSTLTSKIIATMMKNKQNIDEIISTIMKTLPESSVNGVAYSTFSIVQVFNSGKVYIAEYDNPDCVWVRDGKLMRIPFVYRDIEGKNVREAEIDGQIGDAFMIMSDGCIYCGKDNILNYSWNWKAVSEYAEDSAKKTATAQQMADRIDNKCIDLYGGVPTDDTTVAVCRIAENKSINLLTGPPLHKEDDFRMVEDFMSFDGLKIVSGGSTSHMVARILGEKLITDVGGKLDPEIPPIAKINGIDLVTEGVITLNKVVELLELYTKEDLEFEFFEQIAVDNGATRIVCYMIEDYNTVNIFCGKAINLEYTDKDIPFEISVRQNLIRRLVAVLEKMGKLVNVIYY